MFLVIKDFTDASWLDRCYYAVMPQDLHHQVSHIYTKAAETRPWSPLTLTLHTRVLTLHSVAVWCFVFGEAAHPTNINQQRVSGLSHYLVIWAPADTN